MKTDAITKAYESLTDKQRAALYFRYVTDENELEANRVLSAVPRQSYSMSNREFTLWQDGFSRVAHVFAQEHWIARHGLVVAALRLKVVSAKDEHDIVKQLKAFEKAIAEVESWQKLLLSLDAALAAVSKQHGFDLLSVYIRARTVPYKTENGGATTDAEMQTAWVEMFDSILGSPFG